MEKRKSLTKFNIIKFLVISKGEAIKTVRKEIVY